MGSLVVIYRGDARVQAEAGGGRGRGGGAKKKRALQHRPRGTHPMRRDVRQAPKVLYSAQKTASESHNICILYASCRIRASFGRTRAPHPCVRLQPFPFLPSALQLKAFVSS